MRILKDARVFTGLVLLSWVVSPLAYGKQTVAGDDELKITKASKLGRLVESSSAKASCAAIGITAASQVNDSRNSVRGASSSGSSFLSAIAGAEKSLQVSRIGDRGVVVEGALQTTSVIRAASDASLGSVVLRQYDHSFAK